MSTLTVNDFFCGAGGMGLGFKQVGFTIAGAWDFDKYAVKSYKANVGEHVKQADITEMTWKDLPYANIWTFGFPCQDLSVAGKRAGMIAGKTRSGLFFEVMRLLEETEQKAPENLPEIILAENVKGLKPYLPVLEEEYTERGYVMRYALLNSKYFGVPQNRERYFVIGIRKDLARHDFSFPQQKLPVPKLSSILETSVPEKYYMSDEKAQKVIAQALERLEKLGKVHATLQDLHGVIVDDTYGFDGQVRAYQEESPTLRSSRQGQKIIESLQSIWTTDDGAAYCCDANYYKSISPGDVGKGRRTHVVEYDEMEEQPRFRVRRLTPREYARLQGFPDDFKIVVSDTQAYKQFGNAVTVNVAKAIAESIKAYLTSIRR